MSCHRPNQADRDSRYSETVDLLYSSNVFTLHDPAVLHYLPSMLLPQRINSIRTLCFQWELKEGSHGIGRPGNASHSFEIGALYLELWVVPWQTMASMQGLQELRVRLFVNRTSWGNLDGESVKPLLESIGKVTGPKNFTLILPFPAMKIHGQYESDLFSVAEGRQDPWDDLPCTVQRVYDD